MRETATEFDRLTSRQNERDLQHILDPISFLVKHLGFGPTRLRVDKVLKYVNY
jgi:hypothetical protein